MRVASNLVSSLRSPEILDIGCGTGHGAIAMCAAGAGSITGIDLSPAMLRIAERNARARGVRDRIELVAADVMSWPDVPRRWDIVVALGVLEYYADCGPLLARMTQLTRAWVLFSVRAWTPLRGSVRAYRYARLGCPIYFLTRTQIEDTCRLAGYRTCSVDRPRWGSRLVLAHV